MARVFTVEQAAEYLQVSPYTVRKWLRKRRIPGARVGRVYRILEEDLEKVLRESRWEEAVHDTQGEQEMLTPEERHERWLALSQEERDRRVRAARGMFAHGTRSLGDFLREKHEEIEADERRLRERRANPGQTHGSETA